MLKTLGSKSAGELADSDLSNLYTFHVCELGCDAASVCVCVCVCVCVWAGGGGQCLHDFLPPEIGVEPQHNNMIVN